MHARSQQNRGMPIGKKILLYAANGSFTMILTELKIYKCDVNIDRLTAQLKMLTELICTGLHNCVAISQIRSHIVSTKEDYLSNQQATKDV